MWDNTITKVDFIDYFAFKEKRAIGEGIGDIEIQKDSILLNELTSDILSTGGTHSELESVKSMIFYNSWNETIILEILFKDVRWKVNYSEST